jgi:hypothetical protein
LRLAQALLTFAEPRGSELAREELEAGARKLVALFGPKEAQLALLAAGDDARGRPVVRRHVAAAALEAKQNGPPLSRLELAQRFCPCSKPKHDEDCADRLRRDILRLQALIKKIRANYPVA